MSLYGHLIVFERSWQMWEVPKGYKGKQISLISSRNLLHRTGLCHGQGNRCFLLPLYPYSIFFLVYLSTRHIMKAIFTSLLLDSHRKDDMHILKGAAMFMTCVPILGDWVTNTPPHQSASRLDSLYANGIFLVAVIGLRECQKGC